MSLKLTGSASKTRSRSQTTSASNSTSNSTTTPILPDWASPLASDVAGRVQSVLNLNPTELVAPANPLLGQAAAGAERLGASTGLFGAPDNAARQTRQATDTAWLAPHLQADTPFASGGKAYNYVDQYLNPYLQQVVDSSAADFDSRSGQVRAQQALDLAGSGAFGGSGAALTQSMTEGELSRARASTLSGLRSRAFETALGAAAGDADRATQARIANAQTALQDRSQKVDFGFRAGQQQLAGAAQLSALSNAFDANQRENIATQASLAGALRQIDQEQRSAPVISTQQMVALLNGMPIGLFAGQQQAGSEARSGTEATKGSSSTLSVGAEVSK